MTINIQTKKYTAVIEYVDSKNITLMKDAKLGVESPSLDSALKALRAHRTTTNASGEIITTCDLVFRSTSACASFIVGSPQSGNRFFAKYLGNSTNSANTTNSEPNATTTTTTTDNGNNANNIVWDDKSKSKLYTDFKVFAQDFGFNIDPRCMNTMLYQKSVDSYILNFMQVIGLDDAMLQLAKQKMRCTEWKELVSKLKTITPTHAPINNRLIVLYGSAGTGKTTYAMQQYGIVDNNQVDDNGKPVLTNMVIASASADPDEIFTHFNPTTKQYELSPIGEAMKNGTPIIIDEANFYCSEVLKRLQGVTDTKKSIIDNGILITIKDGFKIILTMNLETNVDGKRPLADALVSRAEFIDNYDNHPNANFGWIF